MPEQAPPYDPERGHKKYEKNKNKNNISSKKINHTNFEKANQK